MEKKIEILVAEEQCPICSLYSACFLEVDNTGRARWRFFKSCDGIIELKASSKKDGEEVHRMDALNILRAAFLLKLKKGPVKIDDLKEFKVALSYLAL